MHNLACWKVAAGAENKNLRVDAGEPQAEDLGELSTV